jgi:hypothetical protein
MKYAFIHRHKLVWPICVQCRVLLVSVSGCHEHLARRVDIARRRHLSDEALLVHISAVYGENRGAYESQTPSRLRVIIGLAESLGGFRTRRITMFASTIRAPVPGGSVQSY